MDGEASSNAQSAWNSPSRCLASSNGKLAPERNTTVPPAFAPEAGAAATVTGGARSARARASARSGRYSVESAGGAATSARRSSPLKDRETGFGDPGSGVHRRDDALEAGRDSARGDFDGADVARRLGSSRRPRPWGAPGVSASVTATLPRWSRGEASRRARRRPHRTRTSPPRGLPNPAAPRTRRRPSARRQARLVRRHLAERQRGGHGASQRRPRRRPPSTSSPSRVRARHLEQRPRRTRAPPRASRKRRRGVRSRTRAGLRRRTRRWTRAPRPSRRQSPSSTRGTRGGAAQSTVAYPTHIPLRRISADHEACGGSAPSRVPVTYTSHACTSTAGETWSPKRQVSGTSSSSYSPVFSYVTSTSAPSPASRRPAPPPAPPATRRA